MGRQNCLFSDTPKGPDASSMIYTMAEMDKAHNLNIYRYLNYLLERIPRTAMTDEEPAKLVLGMTLSKHFVLNPCREKCLQPAKAINKRRNTLRVQNVSFFD